LSAASLEIRWFQSSPGLVTGRYVQDKDKARTGQMFQSSPGLVTGRYWIPLLQIWIRP